MAIDPHEAAVDAFLAQARLTDPEKFAAVCARHVVKSRRQMRRISETEIPMGLTPFEGDPSDPYFHRFVGGATDASYAENVLIQDESA